MYKSIQPAYRNEMARARSEYDSSNFDDAFRHVERAHILAQQFFALHMSTHCWMLKIAIRTADRKEMRGQLLRMVAVIPGYLFFWVPTGNTGGANVNPLKKMPVPGDLAGRLEDISAVRGTVCRLFVWSVLLACTFAVS